METILSNDFEIEEDSGFWKIKQDAEAGSALDRHTVHCYPGLNASFSSLEAQL